MTLYALDTGPLVAFLNDRDEHHEWAKEVLSSIRPPLRTCEPVLTEACHLLGTPRGRDAVLGLVLRRLVVLGFHLDSELTPVHGLIRRYASVPMSLADACLVRMTELDARLTVVTTDGGFRIYRRHGRQVVPVLTP